jgi:hypothetical protein
MPFTCISKNLDAHVDILDIFLCLYAQHLRMINLINEHAKKRAIQTLTRQYAIKHRK